MKLVFPFSGKNVRRLRMFEDSVLTRIFGFNGGEITEGWRKFVI
jgi:hypothetical protein